MPKKNCMEVHPLSNNPYLDELMKIANTLEYEEPMNPDAQVVADEDEVAALQGEVENDIPTDDLTDEEVLLQQDPSGQMAAEQRAQQAAEEQAAIEAEAQAQGQQAAEAEAAAELAAEETALAEQDVAEGLAQRQELENTVVQEIIPQMSDEELEEVLVSKVASEIQSLGAIAKIVEYAKGENDYITPEMQKEASDLIEYMVSSEEAFYDGLERTASQLFENEESLQELYSHEGVAYTFEQLATFDQDGFDKQANEDPNALQKLKAFAGSAIDSTKAKFGEAFSSVRNLKQIGEDISSTAAELDQYTEMVSGVDLKNGDLSQLNPHYKQVLEERHADLLRRQGMGRAIKYGGGGAVLAGGALAGGKAIYDHMNRPEDEVMEEKVAGLLPAELDGGTLNIAMKSDINGGIQKMSKELVRDFLKLAGAAGLVSIVNDEERDMDLRKEASEAFDYIAGLGNSAMTEEFVKVAQQLYDEDELHEIVAGNHTEYLMDKVAFFIDSTETSVDELEKTASAGGVAAKIKAVGAGLKDSATNVVNTIGNAKNKAEGAGREYVGVLKDHKGAAGLSHGATGLAGGGLVGGAMAGYNMINNPQEYDIEQTASALEEAFLTKQAAVDAYGRADAFIRQYGHLLNN